MKFKITIKYIYGDGDPSKGLTSALFHHIDSEIVTQYANQNNFTFRKSDFIELLRADGAQFDHDSMRIFSEDENALYLLNDEFDIQIDPHSGPVEIFLWIRPSKGIDNHVHMETIISEIQSLRKSFSLMETQIQELQKNQTSFTEQLQATNLQIQTLAASNQLSQFDNGMQLLNKNFNSPALSIAGPSLGRQDSRYSVTKSEGDYTMNIANPALQTVKSSIPTFDSPSEMPGLQKKKSFIDSSKLPNIGSIDMAILYSEPLVRKLESGVEPLGDPVDFEEESNKLLEILKAKNKRIDLIFQIATKDRLVEVLAKGPSILHIICHGEYSKQEKQFYLCFEGENGELLEFFSDNLRSIIEKIEISSVKLVFVNACHSEEVAKVFLQAGVPCVIAIQSELRIADNVAQKFSQHFYNHIFDGMAIKTAFELAKVAASSMDLNTCCCAHTHKADCPWYKDLALKESFKKAHQFHVPLCLDCPKRNKHIHHDSCKWAQDFQFVYKRDPFDAPSNVSSREIWTCCCSPELPHNESLKFKKFCQNDFSDQMVLIANREAGVVANKNPYSVIEQKFSVKRILGRNRELHQLYEILTSNELKFVQLNGSEGVGKTSLIKQLANYLYERGHFRDKISIIMMEKTPSISHFKSDLYKEIPGAYDFKSFCESIKLSKILFILEKCDMLLENHKKDFVEILKQISEAAKYVKFIIIKNEYERLKLDESLVMMRDLQPMDAAKILLNLSYKSLSINDRKLDELAQRPLFQKIRLTPQKIWCISERLKRESLDYIENDMIFGQDSSYKTKAEENEEAIGKTLRTISDKSQTGYNLVLMICLFISGVTSRDLKQLESLDMIPASWTNILQKLLNTKSSKEKNPNEDEDEEAALDSDDEEEKQESEGDFPAAAPIKDVDVLKPGNYFWTVITKANHDTLYYQPAQFVNKYIDKKLKPEVAHLELRKLQYLTLMALSLIKTIKRIHLYHEKLCENSSVSNHGIWTPNPNNTLYCKYIKDNRKLTYIDYPKDGSESFDLLKIKKVFEFHESNFLSCIDAESIQTIIQTDGSLYGETLDLIEICWIVIPTLFKLISTRESGARDLALRALTMLQLLDIKDDRMLLLKAKLHLFLASLYLYEKNDGDFSVNTVTSELEDVERTQVQIQDDKTHTALSHYVAFTRANFHHKHKKESAPHNQAHKHGIHDHKKHLYSKSDDDKVLQLLKECDAFLKDLDHRYDIERCKVSVLAAHLLWKYSQINDPIAIERIKSSIGVFSVYKLKRLEIKATFIYTQIQLLLLRSVREKKPNDETKIKHLSEGLTQAKNHYLIKSALILARQIKDKACETKIFKLVDEINIEIRYGYFNVFVFLRAAPNVELEPFPGQQDKKDPVYDVKPLGHPTKFGSLFKNWIFESLNQRGKLIFLKFEILTKESLIEALRDGCRILRLNCQVLVPDEDCIVVEDHIGRAERISYTKLKEIFLSTKAVTTNIHNTNTLQQERSFDLLILASKNDKKTANFFAKELMVRHIITFNFKNKEKDFKQKLYEDECIDKFSQYFYEEIVDGQTIKDSFSSAYTKTFDYLSASFFDSIDNNYIIDQIGIGPILLPEDQDHSISLYGTHQSTLPPGKAEDVSKARCPTNVQKLITPFIGRNIDIDAMSQLLVNDRCHSVKLTGEPGVGKTSFMLQLGYFYITHGLFPDGVFYFGLKSILDNNKDLTDVMKETFGSKFENNIKNFFREKKMLLIFDDFDLFYVRNLRFPRLVFCTLKECKISTVIVTNSQNSSPAPKKSKRPDLEQKQKVIEAEFVKSEHTLQTLSREEMAHLLLSLANVDLAANCPIEVIMALPFIKKMEGNPKLLVEKLWNEEITINKRKVKVNSYYEAHLNIDEVIMTQNYLQRLPRVALNLSRHSSNLSVDLKRTTSLKMSKPFLSASLKETHTPANRMKAKNMSQKFTLNDTPGTRRKSGNLTQAPIKGGMKGIFGYDNIEDEEESKEVNPKRKGLQASTGGRNKSSLHDRQIGMNQPPINVDNHYEERKSLESQLLAQQDLLEQTLLNNVSRISQRFGPKTTDLILESHEKDFEQPDLEMNPDAQNQDNDDENEHDDYTQDENDSDDEENENGYLDEEQEEENFGAENKEYFEDVASSDHKSDNEDGKEEENNFGSLKNFGQGNGINDGHKEHANESNNTNKESIGKNQYAQAEHVLGTSQQVEIEKPIESAQAESQVKFSEEAEVNRFEEED